MSATNPYAVTDSIETGAVTRSGFSANRMLFVIFGGYAGTAIAGGVFGLFLGAVIGLIVGTIWAAVVGFLPFLLGFSLVTIRPSLQSVWFMCAVLGLLTGLLSSFWIPMPGPAFAMVLGAIGGGGGALVLSGIVGAENASGKQTKQSMP